MKFYSQSEYSTYRSLTKSLLIVLGTIFVMSHDMTLGTAEAGSNKTTTLEVSKSEQSSIKASWEHSKQGKIKFLFATIPAKGLKINQEGPWSLELKEHAGLDIEKKKLGRQEFDEKISGFTVEATPKAKAGKIDFKMVTFVCTESKTQCFRNVQKGSFDWHSAN